MTLSPLAGLAAGTAATAGRGSDRLVFGAIGSAGALVEPGDDALMPQT